MGAGPIKGFSLTLGIGIFTTLFSVYFIARLFTSIYVSKNKSERSTITLSYNKNNKTYKNIEDPEYFEKKLFRWQN